MANTVFLVQMTGFEYNDEGYYSSGVSETVAVAPDRPTAERWIADNGWDRVRFYVVDNYEWEGSTDWTDPGEQRKAVQEHFHVVEQQVLSSA